MHAFIDDGLELWTRKFIARQIWRFHGEYDAGDLLSEAWLVLDRVTKKYGDMAVNHIMALYKISLVNQFHRLASHARRRDDEVDISEAFDVPSPNDSILVLLVEAPPEIREAIATLLDVDPSLLTDQPTARRETLDQRFHRIIDAAPSDIATKIKNFLRDGGYVFDINCRENSHVQITH